MSDSEEKGIEERRRSDRERTMTEKGAGYSLEVKRSNRHENIRKLNKISEYIFQLLQETTSSVTIVKTEYSIWLNYYEDLLLSHDEYSKLLSEEDKKIDNEQFQKHNTNFMNLKQSVEKWFSERSAQNLQKFKDEDTYTSISTRASTRASSRASTQLSMAKMKESQRQAELKARASALTKKQEIETEKLKLKMKEQEFEIKTELQISEAKSKVIEELERSILQDQQLSETLAKGAHSADSPPIEAETSILNPLASIPTWIPQSTPSVPYVSGVRFNVKQSTPHVRETTNVFHDNIATSYSVISPQQGHISTVNSQPNNTVSGDIHAVARELNKPKADIQTFEGNPMDYNRFIRQFNARVTANTDLFEEKLNYLLQFTKGEAHKIVSGYSHMDAKAGYMAALDEFKDRYGDSDVIAQAYVKKALDWPIIKPDNGKALDEYAIFLRECQYAIDNIEAARILEYSENLKLLVKKLPFYLHEKWRNIVYDTKEKKEVVKFQQLVSFVRKEAKKATDPVYGKEVMSITNTGSKHSQSKPVVKFGTRKNFATSTKDTDSLNSEVSNMINTQKDSVSANSNSSVKIAFTRPCIFCLGSSHAFDTCRNITKKPLKERYTFIKSKGLCFSCLKSGHQKSSCQHKLNCATCKRYHPSVLHVEPRQSDSSPTVSDGQGTEKHTTASSSTEHIGAGDMVHQALPIVPVRLKSENSDQFIETYAFLDSGSTATFCSESIMSTLNIEGKRTKIHLHTMGQENIQDCYAVSGLQICDLNGNQVVDLPPIFTQPTLPVSRKDVISSHDLHKWPHLRDVPLEKIDSDVGLLIGINVPKVMEPWDVIPSIDNGPFAVKTLLGWVINGPLEIIANDDVSCRFVSSNILHVDAIIVPSLDEQLRNQFNHDFNERIIDDILENSREDKQFIDIVSQSTHFKDGHYVVSLPFRSDNVRMPNNRKQAEQRLLLLTRRFERDDNFRSEYISFMDKVIGEGYAQKVASHNSENDDGRIWYLPHHGVYHPKKNKLRVVFDCAARFQGTSLNDQLLQGPNLTNTLIGTLIRFRTEEIAVMGDIDSMFHQIRIPPEDAGFLRFLWWENSDTSKQPTEFQMMVHLFGATSSPSCANFALRKTALDCKGQFNDEVIDTVLKNFYVDDCLKSVRNTNDAVNLVKDLQALLKRGGFRIAKWMSNSREVMRSIPVSERAKAVKDLDLDQDTLPIDRALGVEWNVELDVFCFKMALKEQVITRRGILSTISSAYDPLGFVAPCMLTSKRLIQELCKLHLKWDDPIPENLSHKWILWLEDITKLSNFKVERCMKPPEFGLIKSTQLHHFADASEIGYGTVTYLRLENDEGKIHCSFVMGKSRVAPLKQITIPRLELTAATVAVRTNKMLMDELDIQIDRTFFWTDSMSVLRYIWNTSTRFHTFVANRLSVIHDGSVPSEWRYVNTELNPADHASRGLNADVLLQRGQWIVAPEFLWKEEDCWPKISEITRDIPSEDTEVKGVVVRTVLAKPDELIELSDLFNRYSSWMSLKRSVAWILKVRTELLRRVRNKRNKIIQNETMIGSSEAMNINMNRISLKDINDAGNAILSYVQHQAFASEIDTLLEGKSHVKDNSYVQKLDPILDHGVLRVGGRLCDSTMPLESKNPIILPKNHHVSNLILGQIHIDLKHGGRNHMLARLRETYWLVNAPSAIRKLLSKCIVCRRQSASVGEQKMANLPKDRVTPDEPPFTRVGVDYFGPFFVKQKRSQVKRYGVIFTCLTSRAVHLEIADSLDTNSYINALRRFIARRGQVTKMRSDNGTNFIGSERELTRSINEWNISVIQESMIQKNVEWQFNPPAGSHFGGVWERLIRSIRKVINSTVREQVLNDDCLHTLFCEIEAILNDRPITANSNDHNDLEPLTPNHLLLMKRKPNLPPGVFNKTDNYGKRRWRQVQYMANLFWYRWVREYLPLLQERQKWNKERRNFEVGDIVLIVDSNAPRNSWPMGIVLETIQDRFGLVRQVKVKTSTNMLTRPIDKLCLLLEMD